MFMETKYLFALLSLTLCFVTFPGFNRTSGKKSSANFLSKETSTLSGTIKLKSAKSTFLYSTKATHLVGNLIKQGGDYIEWNGNCEIGWPVNASATEKYDLFLIADIPMESKDMEFVFTHGSNSSKFILNPTSGPWGTDGKNFQRFKVLSEIMLTQGYQEVGLKSTVHATDKTLINIRSLELVPVSAYKSIENENKQALASRASTKWLTKAGYGVMFHWTSQSVNPDGSIKPYAQAVDDFDVKKFVKMVDETGAGYVIFTIGHAEAYCPAPLKKWEKYHPGMTTGRDLIAEISDQLKTKNIRLICYLPTHIVAKYQKVNGTEFSRINTEILQEMGERYKAKIAGYWFDGWYQCFEEYPDVSFKSFFDATKAGNKDRIIALNSWIYPPVTPWQEYWAGEVASPVAIPGNGFMKNGPVTDLRYQALLIMEPYWVQEKTDSPEPRFTSSDLSQYIHNCMKNGGAVTINMGIFQDGTVGEAALKVMKEVRQQIRKN
jgi:hypothetical protein